MPESWVIVEDESRGLVLFTSFMCIIGENVSIKVIAIKVLMMMMMIQRCIFMAGDLHQSKQKRLSWYYQN